MPAGTTIGKIRDITVRDDVRYHGSERCDDILTLLAQEANAELPAALTRDAVVNWLKGRWRQDGCSQALPSAYVALTAENHDLQQQVAALRETLAHQEDEIRSMHYIQLTTDAVILEQQATIKMHEDLSDEALHQHQELDSSLEPMRIGCDVDVPFGGDDEHS